MSVPIIGEKKKPQVAIAIPSKESRVHAKLVRAIFPQIKGNPFMIVAGVSPVAHARNMIVEGFLKTEAEYLWMVDDDTIPPEDALERLLTVDADIVTGVTPIIHHDRKTSNIYLDDSGTPMELKDLEKMAKDGARLAIRGCGASCLLIKRSVIEAMKPPYFAELWSDEGQHITEDIYFCNVAHDMGLTIKCIPSVVCGHAKSVIL